MQGNLPVTEQVAEVGNGHSAPGDHADAGDELGEKFLPGGQVIQIVEQTGQEQDRQGSEKRPVGIERIGDHQRAEAKTREDRGPADEWNVAPVAFAPTRVVNQSDPHREAGEQAQQQERAGEYQQVLEQQERHIAAVYR